LKLSFKILIFLFFISTGLNANEITSILINPLNRVLIKFDSIPFNISSKLSDDKVKITVNVGRNNFRDSLKQISGLGIISDVYITKTDTASLINIRTREKRGYTISHLPFTSQIAIEVFSWEKLSPEEELFRTGLLAEEDKIYDESLKNFYTASIKGYTPAALFLGLSYLRSSYFKQAAISFSYAYQMDSTNFDALAGLAVATLNLGDTSYANILLNDFRKKCNCPVKLNYNFARLELDSFFLDVSHLNYADLHLNDSILATDSSKLKSLAKDTSNIAKTKTDDEINLFNFIIENYQLILFIIGAIGISILYLYMKWRQKKLLSLKSKPSVAPKVSFNTELKNAATGINPQQAANLYKNSESNDKVEKNPEPPEPVNLQSVANPINKEKISRLETLLESITGKPASGLKSNTSTGGVNAKLQLAMHLADEQRKIKTQNLENLKLSTIPSDKKKLSEVSKKLGIEKGGLETKVALEKILKDKDKLRKLSDKFGS
jgi:uncharacterized protein with PQ loop repeat